MSSSLLSSSQKGILWMCAGVFCFSAGDALSKWLGEVHSPVQIIFFRTLVSLPLIALIAHFSGEVPALIRVQALEGLEVEVCRCEP